MFNFRRRPKAPAASRKGSLSRKMAVALLPLTLMPALLVGGAAFLRARSLLIDQAVGQMSTATQSQVSALQSWAAIRQQRLFIGTQRRAILEGTAGLLQTPSDNLGAKVRQELGDLISSRGEVLFSEILIATLPDGEVLVSTNPDRGGEKLTDLSATVLQTAGTRPIFGDATFSPGSLAFFSLSPMRASGSEVADAVLIGVNSGTQVARLMEQLQVYWERRGVYRIEPGLTYLAVAPNILIEFQPDALTPRTLAGIDHPVTAAPKSSEPTSLEYTNPDGASVLAAYQWIPEWDMGVLVELPSSDVYAGLYSLASFTATLIIASAAVILIVTIVAANRVLSPLRSLSDFAARISQGEWLYRLPEDRNDELGALASAFNRMADELAATYQSLEEKVEERTRQVRTAAEVARAATSVPSLDELLRRAVDLIKERFGYDHASIFLLDDAGHFAVLRESTGEVGAAMKARRHSLEVGSQSMIGWVTANNQPRVASDVSADPMHFKNELLPETRSEVSIPLQVSGKVLGALDVQSKRENAFGSENIEILQMLADQLSAAIENARLAQSSATAADRARLITRVTGELSGLLHYDQVLQTAAKSLYHALGQPDIMVKLVIPGDSEDREVVPSVDLGVEKE